MIDFFGSGYDVSERMGILANLEGIHYQIPRLTFVDASGAEKFSIDYSVLRKLFGGRHFNWVQPVWRHAGILISTTYCSLNVSDVTKFALETSAKLAH